MKTNVTVTAHNIDKTENVIFDTTVTHRKDVTVGMMADKAINKCKTMLKRVHPELLAELTEFHVEVK